MNLTADLYGFTEEQFTKTFYGDSAERHLGKLILQDSGERITAVAGAMCKSIIKSDCTHELLVGHFVFQPIARYATNHLRGMGIAGLLTEGGMYERDYQYKYENGVFIPNT